MPRKKITTTARPTAKTDEYRYGDKALARPDVGTQSQFRDRKPAVTYRYDSSLSPALDWDSQNPAREQGEALIAELARHIAALRKTISEIDVAPPEDATPKAIASKRVKSASATQIGGGVLEQLTAKLAEAEDALRKLKALSKPFLAWSGKAERLSFDVPTLPLFVHERLSTKAILETLKGHRRPEHTRQLDMFDLFADAERPIHEQVLKAYQYQDDWVNRMILGDSMVVMNSLLHYEGMRGQVQMIYLDPPYGVKFGSNFQPFVRKRDVAHNDDEDMTREPEMVQAYRDTWELGLHSYLTYLRDRLLLSRELLSSSGSIFVQISDDNLHHVREVMDEVFGAENFCRVITVAKTSGMGSNLLAVSNDYLLWYSRDISRVKFRQLYLEKTDSDNDEFGMYTKLDESGRRYRIDNLTGQNNNVQTCLYEYEYGGKKYRTPPTRQWKTNIEGMIALEKAGRLEASGSGLYYKRYLDDFPVRPLTESWSDTGTGGFAEQRIYVVQTSLKIVQRCMLMTTDPGDLVVDPTCGSGTTAYVAEQWGRRWITIDTSRVPLALARQRLLTATFPWHELKDETAGPGGGFVYKRRQNNKGEEVGGIVPHVMLKSFANNEPPAEEVLVDRPEEIRGVTRITGPFAFEATIPNVVDATGLDASTGAPSEGNALKSRANTGSQADDLAEPAGFIDRMLEILRKSPVIRLDGNRTVTFKSLRRPAKTLSLSAEGVVVNGQDKPVAFVFGPENGAVVEKLVFEAAKEAFAKSYAQLYVIGFAIQPNARSLIENCDKVIGIGATYVQATPDLLMGDLLKNMRSSQIFSVCGMPEIVLRKAAAPELEDAKRQNRKGAESKEHWYEVELLGLDVFDPVTMEVDHRKGKDVPAWFLDTDYNGLSFHVTQAFFPATQAWDNLKRALKGEYDDQVWAHLAGTVSVPFTEGGHREIAVKVIDHRGNELMVVRSLGEAK